MSKERLKEIIKIAYVLDWVRPSYKHNGYPKMQLSEVEKCMIAMVDDFELERMREWYKDGIENDERPNRRKVPLLSKE